MPLFDEFSANDIDTTLNYYASPADGSQPELNDIKLLLSMKHSDSHIMRIHDVRDYKDTFSLDKQGFQFLNLEDGNRFGTDMKDWKSEQIKAEYYPAIQDIYLQATGAKKVIIFNHTIRAIEPENGDLDPQTYLSRKLQSPAPRVHIDQSESGAALLMEMALGEEVAQKEIADSSRWALVNAWKPLKTIYKRPLAVMDARIVKEEDLVVIPRAYGDKKGANLAVKANSNHRWHYLHRQTPEEVLVFKIFDSAKDKVEAWRVPHTSFEHPTDSEGRDVRESIELRAFLFW